MIAVSFLGLFLSLVAYATLTSRFLRNAALLLILPHVITTLAYFGGNESIHNSRFMMLLFVLIGNTVLWIYFMSLTNERTD